MTRNACRLAGAAALLCACAGVALAQERTASAAPELGRLFFSASEREQLERDRDRPAAVAAEIVAPERLVISGLIARPNGPPLPVINGRVLAPGEDLSGLKITGLADGRVRITRSDGQSRLARPGQTVDLTTGEVGEIYDLPGRRAAAAREVALPMPFGSGFAERAVAEPKVKSIKAKKPRRTAGRGKSATGPKPATTPKPAAAPATAKPVPQIAPAGPALPPPIATPGPRP